MRRFVKLWFIEPNAIDIRLIVVGHGVNHTLAQRRTDALIKLEFVVCHNDFGFKYVYCFSHFKCLYSMQPDYKSV